MSYIFKIKLRGVSKPTIWRKVSVPESFTFADFHLVIQAAFGWTNSHLYEFIDNLNRPSFRVSQDSDFLGFPIRDFQEAVDVRLSDYFKSVGDKCIYVYDFGDNWEHDVVLEAINESADEGPSCLKGKGACPPEDCGGCDGFERLKKAAVEGPSDQYDEELLRWFGDADSCLDAEYFDLEESNHDVANCFALNDMRHYLDDIASEHDDDIVRLVEEATAMLMMGSSCYVDYQNNVCQKTKFKKMTKFCAKLNPPTKKQYKDFMKSVIQAIPKIESELRARLALSLNSDEPFKTFDEILSNSPYAKPWNDDKHDFHSDIVSAKAIEILAASLLSLEDEIK